MRFRQMLNTRGRSDRCDIRVECVQPLAELHDRLQHCPAGIDRAVECRQLWLDHGDHVGYAMAQREPGTDRCGVAVGHVREIQRKACQSNARPSNEPSATTKAIRSSAGRLKATSNGTPFRTR